jgi:hypothetical protein
MALVLYYKLVSMMVRVVTNDFSLPLIVIGFHWIRH